MTSTDSLTGIVHAQQSLAIALGVRARAAGLGFADAFVPRRGKCRAFFGLPARVDFHDARGNFGMSPKLGALSGVVRAAERVVMMPVGERGGAHRQLRDLAHGLPLERGGNRRLQAFDHQHGIAADDEAAVGASVVGYGAVADGGVDAATDLPHRRPLLIGNELRRDAAIAGQARSDSDQRRLRGKRQHSGCCVSSARCGCSGDEITTRKRLRAFVHGILRPGSVM